uniref:DUF1361 domain-containing protein n=1 Tax=uncultured bacterium Lac161 TaxID=1403002 RepID=A0A059Q9T7_9BACT|nr:hypothetical protein [uncultured bacterium Lac161]
MWRSIFKSSLRAPLLTLAAASALGVALVGARTVLAWRGQHLYLVWNLFLAWVPLMLALHLEERHRLGEKRDGKFWAAALAWLLFFPNAPYIFTDITHLKRATIGGWWTDLTIILLFAIIGLVLAFISLHRMQTLVSRQRGRLAGWIFVLAVALLSGFGVYLGRFERWNSWDVLVNPIGLLADSFNWVHRLSAKFSLLFGMFLFTSYALLYSLTRIGPMSRWPSGLTNSSSNSPE